MKCVQNKFKRNNVLIDVLQKQLPAKQLIINLVAAAPALAWHDGIGGHNLVDGKLIIKGVL